MRDYPVFEPAVKQTLFHPVINLILTGRDQLFVTRTNVDISSNDLLGNIVSRKDERIPTLAKGVVLPRKVK